MSQAFSPTEIFKRATASTLRAIAERDDLNVGFGPEPPGLSGNRVKLPNPARDLPAEEAAQLRGAADSLALRLRYHDDAVHSKRAPGGPLARSVFEALEQARHVGEDGERHHVMTLLPRQRLWCKYHHPRAQRAQSMDGLI